MYYFDVTICPSTAFHTSHPSCEMKYRASRLWIEACPAQISLASILAAPITLIPQTVSFSALLCAALPASTATRMRPFSWDHDRGSSALADSGLWDACRESRQAMFKMLGDLVWVTAAGTIDPAPYPGNPYFVPATGIATDSWWETRRFSFLPAMDLFVFDPQNLCDAASKITLIDCAHHDDLPRILGFCRNIAFEIDQKWLAHVPHPDWDMDKRRAINAIVKSLIYLPRRSPFYLIDYGLVRRTTRAIAGGGDGGQVFHAANGRFVQVFNDGTWERKFDNPDDAGNYQSVFSLILRLERKLGRALGDGNGQDAANPGFAVLAWEPNKPSLGYE